jgi:hypothetical protein
MDFVRLYAIKPALCSGKVTFSFCCMIIMTDTTIKVDKLTFRGKTILRTTGVKLYDFPGGKNLENQMKHYMKYYKKN